MKTHKAWKTKKAPKAENDPVGGGVMCVRGEGNDLRGKGGLHHTLTSRSVTSQRGRGRCALYCTR